MDVYLSSLGCRLNEAELEGWQRELTAQGDRVVAHVEQAQVAVLNTCAVTGMAGRKSRQLIARLHRQNPEAKLVVTGCYASMDADRVARMEGVDLLIPNSDKGTLVRALREELDLATLPERATSTASEGSYLMAQSRTRAFLKIQDGCRNRCTFCVVTLLRGDEQSVSEDRLIHRIHELEKTGYQEVVLTGVHLGGYGSDIGSSLFQLISRVLAETTIPRIRLTSLEPWDLPDGFFALWANRRLQPHLHLPLQSGCDATLKRMSRRATLDSFRALVADARQHVPSLTLTTDLMVGFPGEDDAEWQQTLDFVTEIGFAHMHIFAYSPREGTKAERLPHQVSSATKKARSRQLHALADTMKRAHLDGFLGTTRPVLLERDGTLLADGRRRFSGHTDNYLKTTVTLAPGVDVGNTVQSVRLLGHDHGVLRGELNADLRTSFEAASEESRCPSGTSPYGALE